MKIRIKYVKKNSGWRYAIQVKKWIFWKTIETYTTWLGVNEFLNTLKKIDDFNKELNLN